jgi:hypothetical protein
MPPLNKTLTARISLEEDLIVKKAAYFGGISKGEALRNIIREWYESSDLKQRRGRAPGLADTL